MEQIVILQEEQYDWDGNLISSDENSVSIDAIVHLKSSSNLINSDGSFDGEQHTVQIFVQPNHAHLIHEGTELEIRGSVFKVVAEPWDWSIGRKPWNTLHKPQAVFTAERKRA